MLTARRPPGPGFQGSALPSFDSVPHHDASLTSLIGRGRHGQALVPPIGTPELLDETKPTTSNTPRNFFFLNPLRKIYTKADPNKAYARNPISRLEGQSLLSSFLCSCVPAPPPCSNLTLGFLLGFRGPNRKKKKKDTGFPQGRGVSTASDPRANSTGLGFCLQGREDDKKDVEMGCCYSVPDAPDVILPGALISQNRPGVRIRDASSQIDRG